MKGSFKIVCGAIFHFCTQVDQIDKKFTNHRVQISGVGSDVGSSHTVRNQRCLNGLKGPFASVMD